MGRSEVKLLDFATLMKRFAPLRMAKAKINNSYALPEKIITKRC